jgi:hypothetical protein
MYEHMYDSGASTAVPLADADCGTVSTATSLSTFTTLYQQMVTEMTRNKVLHCFGIAHGVRFDATRLYCLDKIQVEKVV